MVSAVSQTFNFLYLLDSSSVKRLMAIKNDFVNFISVLASKVVDQPIVKESVVRDATNRSI